MMIRGKALLRNSRVLRLKFTRPKLAIKPTIQVREKIAFRTHEEETGRMRIRRIFRSEDPSIGDEIRFDGRLGLKRHMRSQ
jgi:hypothetical protein